MLRSRLSWRPAAQKVSWRLYHLWYTSTWETGAPREPFPHMTQSKPGKRVPAIFFRTESGRELVREWLKALPYSEDRKRIGEDIKTVEFGWPVGMPVCRPLGQGIHEVRTNLTQNRIARVLFYIDRRGRMVLLHAFTKKTRKTPAEDLALARRNQQKHEEGLR
jgi:phage-related protein